MKNMEIEKKYLINHIPEDIDAYPHYEITQGYVNTQPVIRIRSKQYPDGEPAYVLTVKGNGMLSRQEFELDITKDEFDTLAKKVDGNIISKTRYNIPLSDGLKLELDIFSGLFDGLVMGEIEFPDEAAAQKYNPPAYIGREVTFDKRFHNSNMSLMSREAISEFIAGIH